VKLLVIGHAYMVRANRGWLRALTGLGHEVSLALPRRWPDPLFDLKCEPTEPPLRAATLAAPGAGREGWYVLAGLGRALAAERPDVVRVEHGPGTLVGWQALRLKQRLWPAARLIFFTWWNVPWRLRPPQSWAESALLAQADGAVCGNAAAAGLLRQRGFSQPVGVIPQLGVDLELFRPSDRAAARERHGLPQSGRIVGFVGRLAPEKGVCDLVDALAELPGDCLLLAVGRGDEARLLAHAERRGVRDRMILRPSVPHVAVAGLLPALDALALPSKPAAGWQEQFGHVLIEAMACGVPVVGADSGEIPNVIGEAGLVVPCSDPRALAAALRRVLDERDLAVRLTAAGLERAQQRFSDAAVARANAEFLREVA